MVGRVCGLRMGTSGTGGPEARPLEVSALIHELHAGLTAKPSSRDPQLAFLLAQLLDIRRTPSFTHSFMHTQRERESLLTAA
jgi:hypothetical protein